MGVDDALGRVAPWKSAAAAAASLSITVSYEDDEDGGGGGVAVWNMGAADAAWSTTAS